MNREQSRTVSCRVVKKRERSVVDEKREEKNKSIKEVSKRILHSPILCKGNVEYRFFFLSLSLSLSFSFSLAFFSFSVLVLQFYFDKKKRKQDGLHVFSKSKSKVSCLLEEQREEKKLLKKS